MTDPEPLTLDDFVAGTERRFAAVTGDAGTVELELLESTAHGDPRPFSLLFRGPHAPMLSQGTYDLARRDWDAAQPIFLVPVAKHEDGLRYEAIFG